MSSIYRKGRDGYFYYQAYVNNPETKKKDKRVFHALNTKDELIAKKKQVDFDRKYNRSSTIDRNKKKLFLILLFISVFLLFLFQFSSEKIDQELTMITKKKITLQSEENISNKVDGILPSSDLEISKAKIVKFEVNESSAYDSIADYQIINVEILSKAFSQAKISLVVNNKVHSNTIRYLCKSIVKEYTQFLNFVICVYDNSKNRTSLVSETSKITTIDYSNELLIALFTFNEIEGEFFDFYPKKL